MKSTHWIKAIVVAIAMGGLPLMAEANDICTPSISVHPIDEFLGAQGTNDNFFPPVPDYVGWTDNAAAPTIFALIDYAGFAAEVVGIDTQVRGLVKKRVRKNCSTKVTVALFATNALGFLQSVEDIFANFLPDNNGDPTNNGFLCTIPIFGARAQDVLGEESGTLDECINIDSDYLDVEPALGPAALHISYVAKSGDPTIPDLAIVLNESPCDIVPINIRFESISFGETDLLRIDQKGSLSRKTCKANPESGVNYSREVVEVIPYFPY